MKFLGKGIQRIGPLQRPDSKPPIRFLRSYLQLLKERELMQLFKFSKEELDKGKHAEMREKRQRITQHKLDYVNVQHERKEKGNLDVLVERVLNRFQEFLDQIRVGLLGQKPGFFQSTKLFGLRFYSTIIHEYLGIKSSEKANQQLQEFEEQRPFVNTIARFLAYGGLGFGSGSLMSLSFGSLGFLGGLVVTSAIGAIPLITHKLFGEKTNAKGKMGVLFSVDTIAGQLIFPTTVAIATGLSGFVTGPLSGLGVGLAIMIGDYLVGTLSFYGLWGLLNLGKYKKTGFGSLNDLKKLPIHSIDTVTRIWKKNVHENNQVQAESFLSEMSDIHGKGIVCALPYHLTRPLVGLITGLLYPTGFGPAFIAIYATISPYLYPIYANFYTLVANRVNSVVKEETIHS